MFARGANMIPMEELEGRANASAFAQLVQSAAMANMNMLRVWGGGIFFYGVCVVWLWCTMRKRNSWPPPRQMHFTMPATSSASCCTMT